MCSFMALTGMQTVGSTIGAVQGAQQAGYEASLAQQRGEFQRRQALLEAAAASEEGWRTLGHSRAASGASGFALEGSPLEVLAALAARNARQVGLARDRGLWQAAGSEAEAESALARRRAGWTSQGFGTATSLIETAYRGDRFGKW